MRPRRPVLLAVSTAAVLGTSLAAVAGPLPTLDPDVVPDAVQEAQGCDPTDPALCLLPFPNDRWTTPDSTTGTGLRIDLPVTAMPRNGTDLASGDLGGEGKPMDPTEWNRNDGWSPGAMVLTFVPGLDLPTTWGTADREHSEAGPTQPGYFDHRDQITDIPLSLDPDAPISIINTRTGERHPFWSELDLNQYTEADRRALILRPAVNFDLGTRYVVAMRHLKDASGQEIAPTAAFAAVRDSATPDARMKRVFDSLAAAGIAKDDLYQAWDFTIASQRNLSERALHLRDDAFGRVLGDADLADRRVQGTAPEFAVDATELRTDTWTDSRGREHTQQLRRVTGRVFVPNYLDRVQQLETQVGPQRLPYDAPVPGSRLLDTDSDGLPDQNPAQPWVRVPFLCDVPLDGPSYSVTYGHGLLGTRDQLGDVKWPRRFGFAGCAADWWGMASQDLPTVAAILTDAGNMASLPDRAQQGFLNFMFLQRAMVHPRGFDDHPAFQADLDGDGDGDGLIVADEGQGTQAFYDGNSQGGIMGAPLTALSPDISRSVLGVPGMNYSTLLNRSVDWEGSYGEVYYASYQDPLERQLVFALIQMLWDRGEGNAYGHELTSAPLPGTPAHEVMLQPAYGDHQVANVAAEVMARTAGMAIMDALPTGRHWDRRHLQEFTPFGNGYKGSALVYWDSGNVTPPNGNQPNDDGRDPHGDPRNEPAAGWQEARFLLTGEHVDVCDGGPYLTDNNPLNGGRPSCLEPNGTVGTFKPVGR